MSIFLSFSLRVQISLLYGRTKNGKKFILRNLIEILSGCPLTYSLIETTVFWHVTPYTLVDMCQSANAYLFTYHRKIVY